MYIYQLGIEMVSLIYQLNFEVDQAVYLVDEMMKQIFVSGLKHVVCSGSLEVVYEFLGGDDLYLCLLCNPLQFLELCFV